MNKNKRNGQSKKGFLSGKDNYIRGLFYFAKVLPALTKPLTKAFFYITTHILLKWNIGMINIFN